MTDQMRIMLPGPTPCPASSLREMGRPMINHRGPEFQDMFRSITADLQWAFQTRHEALILTTSGTGAMESAIVNTLSPGDRVLALVTGEFGKRFAAIARTYGAEVDTVEAPYGEPMTVARLDTALKPGYRAVLITHNETSTSLLNPMPQLVARIREVLPDALLLVDAVSGLLTAPLDMDALDLDVVLAGAQKAFMIPPGLAFAAVSPRAWAANATAKMPRFYLDYGKAREFAKKGQTPWTPAISNFFALAESLRLLRAEGLDAIFARHARLMRMVRAGARALGLQLVVEDDTYASRAVTGIFAPAAIGPGPLRQTMQAKYGYVVAGGQGPLTDSIIRIGHCGYYDDADMLGVLAALEASLLELGVAITPGASVAAAMGELRPTAVVG